MKTIPLSQGKFAIVDDCDFERVQAHRWHAHKNRNFFYAETNMERLGRNPGTVSMHRFILGLQGMTIQVDHINRDSLDNRRANLRIATHAENQANREPLRGKGADWSTYHQLWRARIRLDGKSRFIGYYRTKEEALSAHDQVSKVLFRDFHSPQVQDMAA